MKIENYAAITHQGPYLNLNEDTYVLDIPSSLFMIFDGLGGTGIGDVCVQELAQNIQKFFFTIADDPDATLPFFHSPQYLLEGNALVNASFYAHKELCQKNQQQEMSRRAAASGILMTQSKDIATLVSVGNCRCYLWRKQHLQKIFIEENFSFLCGEDQTLPSNAFGLFQKFQYQVKEIRLEADDILLMMTDGIYRKISEDEILTILQTKNHLQKKAQALVDLSNERGNKDNQTILILKYGV